MIDIGLTKMWYNIVVPHNWDVSFGKFKGQPTVVAFEENFQGRHKLAF